MSEEKNVTPLEPQEEKLPKAKRTALVRYMAILFVVAFVLVLLSLVLQYYRSSRTITELNHSKLGAIASAEQMQDENRELEQRVAQMEQQVKQSQKEAQDAQTAAQTAEETAAELEASYNQELTDQQNVYEALVQLLTDEELRKKPKSRREDPEVVAAVKLVTEGKDKLSTAAWEAFTAFAEEIGITLTTEETP